MMNGGCVPGGICRRLKFETAVIWAIACSVVAPGCRNTFTTAIPRSDCDSMCSMSLTVVVRPRSKFETMRFEISSADMPLYCQTIVTIGMLMSGKMSIGVRLMV